MEQDKKTLASQLRAARALLNLSQVRLGELAGVSSMTIKRAEGSGKPYPAEAAVSAIIHALECQGLEFIQENGGGVGVRFHKASTSDATRDSESGA